MQRMSGMYQSMSNLPPVNIYNFSNTGQEVDNVYQIQMFLSVFAYECFASRIIPIDLNSISSTRGNLVPPGKI